MHEVYAALAIAALKQERGQNDRLSEDEFYAQYGEAPWERLRRLVRRVRKNLARGADKPVDRETDPGGSCRLAEA
ncbi:hypothetical protein QWE_12113 [Agrobacterium albertimagni AOL15]|jgi:hypothetical protein|uniref:Uncharacterized protein n=1 Tax=Agrobacterium albertimagni AOL15 TaxID=1156935 RepID=K2Q1J9_9HYPH|nr:hypothetical protein [Agrobacterium albertimagni]EKF58995.1 hypothetical protein QWE_12113 [Agrobacterium albertimagni AOL15]